MTGQLSIQVRRRVRRIVGRLSRLRLRESPPAERRRRSVAARPGVFNCPTHHSGAAAILHASESGATVAEEKRPLFPSLATLLAGHVLRDGEVVILILKPSLWFILFSMMRFAAGVLIAVIAAELWLLPDKAAPYYVEAGVFLIAGRLMWSILNWIGRLYVLTDQRVLRLSGVFTIEIFDCPLRKIAQTRLFRTTRERLWRLGSIEIVPSDDRMPPGVWQTVREPARVLDEINAAIHRARSGLGE